MDDIRQRLDKIPGRFANENFLSNKGLGNEVGIYVFCYAPADEMMVRDYMQQLKRPGENRFRIVEKDLYSVFLEICEEKRVLTSVPKMENQRGGQYLLKELQKIATPAAFAEKIRFKPEVPHDIVVLTGVGKVYPFMRTHNLLENLQHIFPKNPVVVMYPGTFDGQTLGLFGKFSDGNYYRAFNLI